MNKKAFFQRKPSIVTGVIISILISIMAISQEKNFALTKQNKLLAEVSFDQVVLYTLIALEQNYKVKERLLHRVHQNDYYTVILNTAKRLAMADASPITLPGTQGTARTDSTENKE